MKCIRCKNKCYKNGVRFNKQRWKCKKCKYEFLTKINNNPLINKIKNKNNFNFDEYSLKYSQINFKRKKVPSINNAGNVLIISDTHEPYTHPKYFDFVRKQRDIFKCEMIVHIGDVFDNNSINYHEKDPDGHSPVKEFELAYESSRKWIKEFPILKVCSGNHDLLPIRQVQTAGLPRLLLRTNNEIWDLPKTWEWELYYEIDGVIYQHGTGKSGKYAYTNWAIENLQSTVTGHVHSASGVSFQTSRHHRIFGMGVGCGIDLKSFAFKYGENFARRPILGCGVVVNEGTLPIFIPMELS